MSKKKANTSYGSWDILKWSRDLKLAMKFRLDQEKLSQTRLAEALGVDRFRVSKFLDSQKDEKLSYKVMRAAQLSHFDILRAADLLGLDVKLSIKFREDVPLREYKRRSDEPK